MLDDVADGINRTNNILPKGVNVTGLGKNARYGDDSYGRFGIILHIRPFRESTQNYKIIAMLKKQKIIKIFAHITSFVSVLIQNFFSIDLFLKIGIFKRNSTICIVCPIDRLPS